MKRLGFLAFLTTLLAGCVTQMNVQPVGSTKGAKGANGIRYYLPKTYLLVTPAKDGSIAVEKVFLPDPDHEYAIDSKAWVSKYKLSVEVDERGLLKKVVWNADDAASTKAALDTAANLKKAQIDAASAAAKSAADAKQKQADAITTAADAVAAAQLVLDQAQAVLTDLETSGTTTEQRDARLAVEKATIALRAAQAKLRQLQAAQGGGDTSALRSDPKDDDFPVKAWGPVLYEVIDSDGPPPTVTLRPVNVQHRIASSKKLAAPVPEVVEELRIVGSGVLLLSSKKPLVLTLQPKVPIEALDPEISLILNDVDVLDPDKVVHVNLNPNSNIMVDVGKTAKPGTYDLTLTVTIIDENGEKKPVDVSVTFEVR